MLSRYFLSEKLEVRSGGRGAQNWEAPQYPLLLKISSGWLFIHIPCVY